jgi:diphthine synthase
MALYIIGIGLSDEKDITVKGLETVKRSDFVYLEVYTSVLQIKTEKLEQFYGKKIIRADRDLIENRPDEMIERAKKKDVSLMVIGDPLSATTHIDIMMRAKEKNVDVKIIFNASVLTAVGMTGLQLYKFGKTTSLPFPENVKSETAYDVIVQNQKNKMHTLVLLDLDPIKDKFMKVNDAIRILSDIEKRRKESVFTDETLIVGCARLGSDDFFVKAGKAKELMKIDFGKPPHCLIIPSEMHFMEEDALKRF